MASYLTAFLKFQPVRNVFLVRRYAISARYDYNAIVKDAAKPFLMTKLTNNEGLNVAILQTVRGQSRRKPNKDEQDDQNILVS